MAILIELTSGQEAAVIRKGFKERVRVSLPYWVLDGERVQLQDTAGKTLAEINCIVEPPEIKCGRTKLIFEQKGQRLTHGWNWRMERTEFGYTWKDLDKSYAASHVNWVRGMNALLNGVDCPVCCFSCRNQGPMEGGLKCVAEQDWTEVRRRWNDATSDVPLTLICSEYSHVG